MSIAGAREHIRRADEQVQFVQENYSTGGDLDAVQESLAAALAELAGPCTSDLEAAGREYNERMKARFGKVRPIPRKPGYRVAFATPEERDRARAMVAP